MSRCVIVGAGEILDYAYIRSFLLPDDYFVLCDGGINHVDSLGITVDEYVLYLYVQLIQQINR